jgi:hypothetical protein
MLLLLLLWLLLLVVFLSQGDVGGGLGGSHWRVRSGRRVDG